MTQPVEPEVSGLNEAMVAAAVAAMTPVVLAALTRWLAAARTAVLGGEGSQQRPSLTMLSALDRMWASEVDAMIPDLVRAARRGWESAADQLGVSYPFDPSDPILVDQVARTRNLLVKVDDEVYRMIIRVLADGADNGWSSEQIATKISNILDVTGTLNWPHRAHVIADTEVPRFAEAGALSMVQRFQARTGRTMLKTWVDRDDDRVRRGHRQVDGTTVGVNSTFRVGRSLLKYPAAPNGFAADVIACRCRLTFKEARRVR